MPSRVAANTNQVGGNFCQQPATFDNPEKITKVVVHVTRFHMSSFYKCLRSEWVKVQLNHFILF